MSKYFTEDHEWVVFEDGIATVGITNHAQEQLGDIVFVELPEINEEFEKSDDISVIESVKAAGDVHSPISGVVIKVNDELDDNPSIINESPEGDGWIYKMNISELSELDDLMNEEEYENFIND